MDNDTYVKARINKDVKHLVFSNEITGTLEPGSLNHLAELESIILGNSMTSLIQPGVIPDKPIHLILPLAYTHPTDASQFPPQVQIYLRTTNVSLAPTDRSFYLWEPEPTTITIPKLGNRTYAFVQNDSYFLRMSNQLIFSTELIPPEYIDTTPEPSIFQILASLSENTGNSGTVADNEDSDMLANAEHSETEPTVSLELLKKLVETSRTKAFERLDVCAREIAREILTDLQKASDDGTLHNGIESTYNHETECNICDLVNALAKHVPPSCISAHHGSDGKIAVRFSYKP